MEDTISCIKPWISKGNHNYDDNPVTFENCTLCEKLYQVTDCGKPYTGLTYWGDKGNWFQQHWVATDNIHCSEMK